MYKQTLQMLALIMKKQLLFKDKIVFNTDKNCLEYFAVAISEHECFKIESEVYKLDENYLKDTNINYLDTLKYSALLTITASEKFIEYKK